MMIGCIAKKVGMTRVFDENGFFFPVTILEVRDNWVVGIRNKEKNGYDAVQIGYGINSKNKNKSLNKAFKNKIPLMVKEFRLNSDDVSSDGSLLKVGVGNEIGFDQIKDVDFFDVQANSIGKGFQGVVKRYGMSGGPKTHGSHFHRVPGSIGNCSYPGRVMKGKKLPGQMGFEKVTIQNLKKISSDEKNKLILVCGSVPGKKGNLVILKKSVKK